MKLSMKTAAIATVVTSMLVTGAASKEHAQGPGHSGHAAHGRLNIDSSAVSAFKAAHAKMMRNMNVPYTGDPDVDFRTHMIPHHQGAIDTAKVALRHAKDAWTRQSAQAIIIAQQQEIHQLQSWLARRGVKAPPGGHPRYIITANTYPTKNQDEEPGLGTQAELAG